MNARTELVEARENVIRAALDVLVAERALSDEKASAQAVMDAEERLALASRSLARAVDALPTGRRPRGWGQQ